VHLAIWMPSAQREARRGGRVGDGERHPSPRCERRGRQGPWSAAAVGWRHLAGSPHHPAGEREARSLGGGWAFAL